MPDDPKNRIDLKRELQENADQELVQALTQEPVDPPVFHRKFRFTLFTRSGNAHKVTADNPSVQAVWEGVKVGSAEFSEWAGDMTCVESIHAGWEFFTDDLEDYDDEEDEDDDEDDYGGKKFNRKLRGL